MRKITKITSLQKQNSETISIREVAQQLYVSMATVRNWIKEGHLSTASRGQVLVSSLEIFIKEQIGTRKLISRANKLFKLTDQDISQESKSCSIDKLYEESLSESFKNKKGIYYTPEEIIRTMLKVKGSRNATFLDPCCGCGNFLLQALDLGVRPENLYGFDTDPNAVRITIQRIEEKTGYKSDKIICGDFLNLAQTITQRFDYIYTNPPWGQKLSIQDKKAFALKYQAGNSTDSSALFYFAAKLLLKKGGVLGFLLPEAALNIGTFEDMRRSMLSYSIVEIRDFGKPFKGVQTKAYSIAVVNEPSCEKSAVHCCFEGKVLVRSQLSFKRISKCIFNIWATEEEANLILNIQKKPHYILLGNASWGMGIVTGDNSRYCFAQPAADRVPVFLGRDISNDSLSEPHVFIDKDFSRYQQVAPISLYMAPEKVIYRFISSRLIFYYDNKQRFILNSANMFVLNAGFPVGSAYLADYFSSEFINWLFSKIFHTHKILRSDLESLPIFYETYNENVEFDEGRLLQYLDVKKSGSTYLTNGE